MCDLVQDRFRRRDAAASRLAESGKVGTGSTEKKPLKEKPAQKEAEDAKTQQGVQEDDTELTVETD